MLLIIMQFFIGENEENTRGRGETTRGKGRATRGRGEATRERGRATRGRGRTTRGRGATSRVAPNIITNTENGMIIIMTIII